MQTLLEKFGLLMENYLGAKISFKRSNDTSALSLMHCSILFGWDAVFYQNDGDKVVFISHDGEAFAFGLPFGKIKTEVPIENRRVIGSVAKFS